MIYLLNTQSKSDTRMERASPDIAELEEEARQRAVHYVVNLLKRPEQLEQLPGMILRTARKKASIDAMLNTAMTGQTEGISSGLSNLQRSLALVKEIRTDAAEVFLDRDSSGVVSASSITCLLLNRH